MTVMENTHMRTVSKTLLSLSICLGLSGAVYAQTAPETKPAPASSAATKSKTPSVAKTEKDKPAAVSDASKTPMKHEHANHAAKPAGKADKVENTDAKKVEASKVEAKPEVKSEAKPEAKKVEHKKAASKPHEAPSAASTPVESPKPVK